MVFDRRDGLGEEFALQLPCGQCIGCRLEKSRQWAVRCMHEASCHRENSFVTLTYADEFLPPSGSLDRRAFPLFMKRLREVVGYERVRYFYCGEYGERTFRPHYHALLFGLDFPDKVEWSRRGDFPVWRSAVLEDCWSLGQSEIGSVTFDSAAYVARYVMKKVTGPDAEAYYNGRTPEFVGMSRGRKRGDGIGGRWYREFGSSVAARDSVIVAGRECKPPRYYDQLLERSDPGRFAEIAEERDLARSVEENEYWRLAPREVIAQAKLNLIKERGL